MTNLGPEEQFTLELIAEGGEHAVLDRVALFSLERRGLVRLSDEGWDVTPLGASAIDIAA
jgi:ribosomal protein S19E (S16A)